MDRYNEYKDSDVQWLGEIPSHWEVKRLASYFSERKVKVSDKDYEPLSVTKNGIFPQLENVAKTNDGDNRKLVLQGDFVINSRSDRKGSSGVSKYDGSVSLINIVLKPRKNVLPDYCNYILKGYAFVEEYYRNGRGIVADLWTTRFDEMKTIKICMPPLAEQQAIAAYLDEQTAKIDTAIAQQQKMIDLLNERKQIIINRAVTKGLNPNAKMKPSGIDWIGNIPESSIICKLKQYVDVTDGTHDTPKYVNIMSNTYPLVTSRCIIDGNIDFNLANHISEYDYKEIAKRSYVSKYDVIMPMIGTVGNPALVTTEDKFAIKNVALFRTQGNYQKGKLLLALLNSNMVKHQMSLYNKGGVQNFVSQEIIKNLIVIIPNNIQEIIEYIDIKCSEIDEALKNFTKQITLLQERKQIIINDVVTGKVKVSLL